MSIATVVKKTPIMPGDVVAVREGSGARYEGITGVSCSSATPCRSLKPGRTLTDPWVVVLLDIDYEVCIRFSHLELVYPNG